MNLMFFAQYPMPPKIDGLKNNVIQIFGGKTATSDPSIVGFYTQWDHYLAPINSLIASFINWILSGIMVGLFKICLAMEQIFTLSFKVIGLTDTFQNKDSVAYLFFHGFQILGTAIAGLIFVFFAIKNMIKSEVKYKDALVNIAYVLMFTAALPWGVSQIGTATTTTVNAISSVDNSGMKVGSLASQPIIDNTVDMVVIANNGFNQSKYKLDKNGLIDTSKKGKVGKLNNLKSNDDILTTDFAETLGPTSKDIVKDLNKNQKGAGDIFTHELVTKGVNKDGSTNKAVMNIKDHTIVKANNAFEHIYSRFRINWFGVYAELAILSFMFLTMSIRLVKSGLDIIIMVIISPWVGLRSVSSKRKYKELLLSIEGAFASMIMNIVVLKLMYTFMQATPQLLGNTSVGPITKIVFNIVVYLGAFLGAFQGIGAIERFTGVAQGHAETAQQLLGAAGVGGAMGAAVANAGRSTFGGVKRAASDAKGLTAGTANKISSGQAAEGLGGLAGTMAHPIQAGKDKMNQVAQNIQGIGQNNRDGFKQGLGKHTGSENNTNQNGGLAGNGGGNADTSSKVGGNKETSDTDINKQDGHSDTGNKSLTSNDGQGHGDNNSNGQNTNNNAANDGTTLANNGNGLSQEGNETTNANNNTGKDTTNNLNTSNNSVSDQSSDGINNKEGGSTSSDTGNGLNSGVSDSEGGNQTVVENGSDSVSSPSTENNGINNEDTDTLDDEQSSHLNTDNDNQPGKQNDVNETQAEAEGLGSDNSETNVGNEGDNPTDQTDPSTSSTDLNTSVPDQQPNDVGTSSDDTADGLQGEHGDVKAPNMSDSGSDKHVGENANTPKIQSEDKSHVNPTDSQDDKEPLRNIQTDNSGKVTEHQGLNQSKNATDNNTQNAPQESVNHTRTQNRTAPLTQQTTPIQRRGGTHFAASNRASQSMNQIISASQRSHTTGVDVDDEN
ncbi:hypothetical protein EFN43_02215 [Pediococcus pentosaceus]|nr:hypothetical protein [Pediococcus pentosaceus]MCT3019901.1 hypothetical protein [Pediococcus pentosaceus]